MGYDKITNLLGKLDKNEIPKFTKIKYIEIFDHSNGTYNKNKDIRFKTNQLRNDLCDFNGACIVVTGKVTATNANLPNNIAPPAGIFYIRKVYFKNSALFFNCTLKINSQLIEDAQDLDIAMPMYNLLYYSKSFRKTTGSFWNYYPDKPNSSTLGANDKERVFYPIRNPKSFDYKSKLVGTLPDGEDDLEEIKIVALSKNLSNFMFNLDFLLINSEIELILKWIENCVLTERAIRKRSNTKS